MAGPCSVHRGDLAVEGCSLCWHGWCHASEREGASYRWSDGPVHLGVRCRGCGAQRVLQRAGCLNCTLERGNVCWAGWRLRVGRDAKGCHDWCLSFGTKVSRCSEGRDLTRAATGDHDWTHDYPAHQNLPVCPAGREGCR